MLYAEISSDIMKRWIAILSGVLLVWMQFAPPPASASVPACCAKAGACMAECAKRCGCMACCVAHPNSAPQPAPAAPNRSTLQHQLALLAPAIVAWMMPAKPANTISSARTLPVMAAATPLYERNCTLLI
jgi:hypothetical protein